LAGQLTDKIINVSGRKEIEKEETKEDSKKVTKKTKSKKN